MEALYSYSSKDLGGRITISKLSASFINKANHLFFQNNWKAWQACWNSYHWWHCCKSGNNIKWSNIMPFMDLLHCEKG